MAHRVFDLLPGTKNTVLLASDGVVWLHEVTPGMSASVLVALDAAQGDTLRRWSREEQRHGPFFATARGALVNDWDEMLLLHPAQPGMVIASRRGSAIAVAPDGTSVVARLGPRD